MTKLNKNEFINAIREVGKMSDDGRRELSKCRWCNYVLIAIVVIFTIAVFMHPTGGAG